MTLFFVFISVSIACEGFVLYTNMKKMRGRR